MINRTNNNQRSGSTQAVSAGFGSLVHNDESLVDRTFFTQAFKDGRTNAGTSEGELAFDEDIPLSVMEVLFSIYWAVRDRKSTKSW